MDTPQLPQGPTTEIDHYYALFNAMDEGFCIIDVLFDDQHNPYDYRFIQTNPAFIQQTGLVDAIGKTMRELAPNQEPSWFEIYGRIARTGIAERFENNAGALGFYFEVYAFRIGKPDQHRLAILFKDISQRKQLQQQLLRLQEELAPKTTDKYLTLLNSIDEGLCTLEVLYDDTGKAQDWRYLEANEAYMRQTGQEDPTGKLGSELTPNAEPGWLATLESILRTGQPLRFEQFHQDTWRWYSLYMARVGGDRSHQIATVFTDITERKRLEQQQAYLLDLNDALRPMADPIAIQRVAMRVLGEHLGVDRAIYAEINIDEDWFEATDNYTSKSVEKVTGRFPFATFGPPGETLKKGESLVIDDVRTEVDEDAQKAFLSIDVQAVVAVPLIKNGTLVADLSVHQITPRHWLEHEVALIAETAERTWAAVERAKAEDALQASQKRFESIANLVPDLLWDSQPDGATNWYNDRWLAYTGQSFEEGIGWGWVEAIHPDERDASARRYEEAVAAGTSLRQEHRIRRYDGAYRWFVVSASPLKDARGQVVRMYGAATDIDDLKRLEATLREADRRKDEFLAMLGHELRNPLASLSNTLLVLQLTKGVDESLSYPSAVEQMSQQADHMRRLVDDLLDIGRIRYGLIHLQTKPVDLVTIARQTLELMKPFFEEQQRQLWISLPPYSLPLLGDETRLKQVLMNLLTNALKFTNPGGQVWVSLQLIAEGDQPKQARLRVKDDGIGIAPEQQAAIFDIFVQGKTSLDRPQGGLGLGLAVVKQLVTLHEGSIEVRSEGPGQGSEFMIRLPLIRHGSLPETRQELLPNPAQVRGRVLVVDDNPTIADTTARLVELSGYQARPSYSGADALEVAQQWRPDVILLDLGLPDMDGFEVNRLLKEQTWGNPISVVALTGYGQASFSERLSQAGFAGYMLKPLNLVQLRELLSRIMAER